MRIRRRPPGAQPLAYLLPTDPYPPPPPSREHPGDKDKQGEGGLELHLVHPAPNHSSAADLGGAAARSSSPLRRPALPPQDGAAVEERSRGGGLLGAQKHRQGPADGRRRSSSLENGLHRHVPKPATNQAAGELVSNNAGVAAVVTTTPATGAPATKQKQKETKNTSGVCTKRAPPSPGKLVEGSRCSRKNGRGWRCSQPTPMGYALCEYHLGKGRVKSGSTASGRGPGQLGRTEHPAKKTTTSAAAAAVAPATAAAPKAAEDAVSPPPPSVQHC